MEEIFPPENIEGLKVNKVNIEVWRKISHSTNIVIPISKFAKPDS